jgi:hypothetical protein
VHTIEQWADIVGGAVRLTDPDDAWQIAILCFDAERANLICNVWHNAAIFYNTPCHCAVCKPHTKRFL